MLKAIQRREARGGIMARSGQTTDIKKPCRTLVHGPCRKCAIQVIGWATAGAYSPVRSLHKSSGRARVHSGNADVEHSASGLQSGLPGQLLNASQWITLTMKCIRVCHTLLLKTGSHWPNIEAGRHQGSVRQDIAYQMCVH